MKTNLQEKIALAALGPAIRFIKRNPDKNLNIILNVLEKLDTQNYYSEVFKYLHETLRLKNNAYVFAMDLLNKTDPHILKKIVENLIMRASITGYSRQKQLSEEHQCNIPWSILMDPTTACNLRCTGCWAADYDHTRNLPFEQLDRIIEEGKKLSIYAYLFSGGEPLIKKDLLIKLCEKHSDCYFIAFTNGTLVDEHFADMLYKVGNFTLAFSIEGFEEDTDRRRGKGTYRKVLEAMKRLRERNVPFGYSTCYHALNTEAVGSDAYVDFLIEQGAKFAWYFTYMPVGNTATADLLASPEQRAYMYRQVRHIRATKPLFALDFWNDGEFVGGCIAGGRRYLHINANGDVEPCAFIHYSNLNIKNVSLLDALKSDLFQQYRKNQPFNHNHLRPCPLLDNPGALARMVHASHAVSTDQASPEDVDALTAKCRNAALCWAPEADKLWEKRECAKVVATGSTPENNNKMEKKNAEAQKAVAVASE